MQNTVNTLVTSSQQSQHILPSQQSQQIQMLQQQHMHQQLQSLHNQHQHQLQYLQQDAIDPVAKFKFLVGRLDESLQKLNWAASYLINQNIQVDSCTKNIEIQQSVKFDKNFEDLYAILDQMELNLKLSLEVLTNSSEAHRYVPAQALTLVSAQPCDSSFTYPQYIKLVNLQLSCARDVRDCLVEYTKTLV